MSQGIRFGRRPDTAIGFALVSEHVVVPMELGSLLYRDGETAFAAEYIILGGGNAKHVEPLPEGTRRGGNEDAFIGGIRLWEEFIEPHDRRPPPVWRVVR